MFEWRNEFSVQIGTVDAQHKMLFAIADELYTAMSVGRSKLALGCGFRRCRSPIPN
jgi:hemerythrin